jgi:hypothetical protein
MDEITDAEILGLEVEAGAAGDLGMVRICRAARLDRSDYRAMARAECARVLADWAREREASS